MLAYIDNSLLPEDDSATDSREKAAPVVSHSKVDTRYLKIPSINLVNFTNCYAYYVQKKTPNRMLVKKADIFFVFFFFTLISLINIDIVFVKAVFLKENNQWTVRATLRTGL